MHTANQQSPRRSGLKEAGFWVQMPTARSFIIATLLWSFPNRFFHALLESWTSKHVCQGWLFPRRKATVAVTAWCSQWEKADSRKAARSGRLVWGAADEMMHQRDGRARSGGDLI